MNDVRVCAFFFQLSSDNNMKQNQLDWNLDTKKI